MNGAAHCEGEVVPHELRPRLESLMTQRRAELLAASEVSMELVEAAVAAAVEAAVEAAAVEAARAVAAAQPSVAPPPETSAGDSVDSCWLEGDTAVLRPRTRHASIGATAPAAQKKKGVKGKFAAWRCRECEGCQRLLGGVADCGTCHNCKNKLTRKQACKLKMCAQGPEVEKRKVWQVPDVEPPSLKPPFRNRPV